MSLADGIAVERDLHPERFNPDGTYKDAAGLGRIIPPALDAREASDADYRAQHELKPPGDFAPRGEYVMYSSPDPQLAAIVAEQRELNRRTVDRLTDVAAERKVVPIATGFLDYFPRAVAAVAALSYIGNEQHNPGTPLHWDRSKSGDEADALMRHFLQRGTVDSDGVLHTTKVAWRAMAALEKELEAAAGHPQR